MMLLLLLIFLKFNTAHLDDFCKTPSNEDGDCLVITDCPPLYSILKQRPLNYSGIQHLKNSNCGYEQIIPKVCCKKDFKEQIINVTVETKKRTLQNPLVCGVILEDRVSEAEITDLDEFPWLALVQHTYEEENETLFECVGVLINQRYILMSVNCAIPHGGYTLLVIPIKGAHKKIVRLGKSKIDDEQDCVDVPFTQYCAPPPVDIGISEIFLHNKYNPKLKLHNIALVKLDRDVPLSDFVQPICLPISQHEINQSYNTSKAYISGYGQGLEGGPIHKRKLELTVFTNNNCNKTYFPMTGRNITNFEMCAGSEDIRNSCEGGFSGPLMIINIGEDKEPYWSLIGITSYGVYCSGQKVPEVYTRITEYVDWIGETMKF